MSYLNIIYSSKNTPFTKYPAQLVNHLIKKFNIDSSGKILDIAAGRGEFINEFFKNGLESYSIDRENKVKEYYPKSDINHKCFN